MRPTRLLAYAAFAGAAAALVLALPAAAGGGPALARPAALFLACFGLGKVLIGIDAVLALAALPAGGADPRLDYGRPALFWLWVAFKLAAGLGACAAAAFLWGRDAAFAGH